MNTILLMLSLISHANAGYWNEVVDNAIDFGCLDLDGIPIPLGGDLANKCCNLANKTLKSTAGDCAHTLYASEYSLQQSGSNGAILASAAINATLNMLNNTTTFDETPTQLGSNSVTNPSDSSAVTAGPGDVEGGGSTEGTTGTSSFAGAGSGARGGVAGGASGSGGGVGTSGGTTGLAKKEEVMKGKNSAGGYGSKGAAGKSGDSDFKMFGMLGGAGQGGAGAGGDLQDYQLGEAAAGDGQAGAGLDEDGLGSTEDPSDYFNRTNKSDDLFKIVSARYLKKKSLWAIPQKLPQKKI